MEILFTFAVIVSSAIFVVLFCALMKSTVKVMNLKAQQIFMFQHNLTYREFMSDDWQAVWAKEGQAIVNRL